MKQRGITLIEILITLGMTVLILLALTSAYSAALDYSIRTPERLAKFKEDNQTNQFLNDLVSKAFISQDPNDNLTYFIATDAAGQPTNADNIVFTTLGKLPSGSFLRSEEEDFEFLNETYGPQGGVTEVSLSTVPVGEEAEGEGLFLRIQSPSDGDFTQGGTERLLIPDTIDYQFEFWDGTQWQTGWDTRTNQRRIPAAVRITYSSTLNDSIKTKVIRFEGSNITQENPLTQSTDGNN